MTKDGRIQDDALGGRASYLGHLEVEIPLGSGAKDAGFKPSVFVDAGSVFGLKRPITEDIPDANDARLQRPVLDASGNKQCIATTTGATPTTIPSSGVCPSGTSIYQIAVASPFKEVYYGNSWKPRVSVGFGVSWNSPFGPLRIDIAKALVKQKGDDTKLFSFNVGTQF